jgi:hypothetical protein
MEKRMYKPDFGIEKPQRSQITLDTQDLVLYLIGAFFAGSGIVVLYFGL